LQATTEFTIVTGPGPKVVHASIRLSVLAFASALLASLALTYVVRERARRARLFDPTDERKLHTRPIPRVGGIAIFWSVSLALLAMTMLAGFDGAGLSGSKLLVIILGGAAIHLLGLWDDLRNIRARYKFAIQIGIAAAIFLAGVRIDTIALPLLGQISFGHVVALLFTILWFVGITNAFNLIDGLDGLASGAALFALTTMFVVATINQQAGAALVTLAVAGATLGFLRYNFHPASIFLGDSGALYLGFMLAGIGAISSQKGSTVVAISIPLVSLGLPVLDTTVAILRRFLRGQPIFSADRGHIHHRLLGLGLSPAKVALLMYAGCAVLALGGMLLVNSSGYVAIVLVIIGLGAGLVIQRLRYYEFQELGRLLRKGVQQRHVIGKGVRMREAGLCIAQQCELDSVFDVLEHSFQSDDFQRAEIRLRQSFALTGATGKSGDRRLDDDVAIWSWDRGERGDPMLWEIKLPLVAGPNRIGSMVLWKDGSEKETSLSHIHTIAGPLRLAVQSKIAELWPNVIIEERRWADSSTTRAGGGATRERIVPLVAADELHRRREELATITEPRSAQPTRSGDISRQPRAS
jgi:UDP-GlcNAc:undecaprenyl-phosphate GlcNAc-1-phosphate transferase